MTKTEIKLSLAKETKGALRYEEDGFGDGTPDQFLVGTIYMRKAKAGSPYPKAIKVTVEEA